MNYAQYVHTLLYNSLNKTKQFNTKGLKWQNAIHVLIQSLLHRLQADLTRLLALTKKWVKALVATPRSKRLRAHFA